MAYVPTTFVDRSVEFPNRRKLTAVSGLADTFDVARAEGTVFAEGTKPDAANLNAEFGKIKAETDAIIENLSIIGTCIYSEYISSITVSNFASITKITIEKGTWLVGFEGTSGSDPNTAHILFQGKDIRFGSGSIYPITVTERTLIDFLSTYSGTWTLSYVQAFAIRIK